MSQTMSNPNDWIQFYHQNFPSQPPPSSLSNSTTTSTTTATISASTTTTSSHGMLNSSTSSTATNLSPAEGRVSKPIRRRSRASRRTPTTLLNTDTTNFRAMVQQFTGGPTAPFAPTASPASSSAFPNLGLAFGSSTPLSMNPTALMVAPPGYHILQHQQQQLYQQQINQHYMYSSGNIQGGADNTFFQRLSNPRPPN